MSFVAVCWWTLARSLLVALMAWPVCARLERVLRTTSAATTLLWLIALPFLFPELLLGYLIAPLVAGVPWRCEVACAAILLVRCVPVGVVALWGTPPSALSRAALHLRRMTCRSWRDRWELWRCYLYGPLRRALPAAGLMFLVAFQEFEAAAMLGAVSWTDRLFVEHALGLSVAESGRFLAFPLAIQIVALLAILWSLSGLAINHEPTDDEPLPGCIATRSAWGYAATACLATVVLPLGLLARDLAEGWSWLVQNPSTWRMLLEEIGNAALVSLVAGLAAWNVAALNLTRPRPWARAAIFSLPGLCGGLTIALAVLWLKHRPLMSPLAATPVFWALALVIWLAPRAVLLQLWLARRTEPAALHLVELLRRSPSATQRRMAGRWRWRWRIEPQVVACGVLCYWAYLDLTSAALLAPPGMASVVVRLYNFMHFGHSAAMSMESAIVMFLPLAAWVTMMGLARWVNGGSVVKG
jgi:hypothetical protein